MKVLYIAHVSSAGGSTIALLNIIKGLKNFDLLPIVVSPTAGMLADELSKLGVKCYVSPINYSGMINYPKFCNPFIWIFHLGKSIAKYLVGHYFVKKIIKLENPNIVHSNTSICHLALKYCVRKNIPYVWHIREFMAECGYHCFPSNSYLEKLMHIVGVYNIAITKSVFDYYQMRSIDTVIYDGVISDNVDKQENSNYSFPYFLCVANISAIKGIECLISSFGAFHKTNVDYHLLVAGQYNERDPYFLMCKNLVEEKQLNEFVHFLGFRTDVYALMRSAVALVVPSIKEGFGFTVAEAMFSKCIVIGRNVSGVKEQFDLGLENTGSEIGLRFSTEQDLPYIMQKVVKESFSVMKTTAHNYVKDVYSIRNNSEKIYSYYQYVLSQKS